MILKAIPTDNLDSFTTYSMQIFTIFEVYFDRPDCLSKYIHIGMNLLSDVTSYSHAHDCHMICVCFLCCKALEKFKFV